MRSTPGIVQPEHPVIASVGLGRDKEVDPGLVAGRVLQFDYLGHIECGRGWLELERGRPLVVEAGSLMRLPARQWHAFNPAPGTCWNERWILLRPGCLPPPLAALWPTSALTPGVHDPEYLLAWEELHRTWFFRPPGWSELALFQLHRLLIAVRGLARPSAPVDGVLRRLHQELFARIAEPELDLGALARQEGLGYDAFRRHFRRLAGVAPKRYFLDLKIAFAKELLLQSGIPVAEVGRRVGLADPYYFSRLFRRKTGLSPRAFRNATLAPVAKRS